MAGESTGRKIWNVIYPILAFFVLYFGVIFISIAIITSVKGSGALDGTMEQYFPLITSIALVLGLILAYFFYRKDHVVPSKILFRKPQNILFVLLLGAAASHGMSILFSLIPFGSAVQSYEAVQTEIFSGGVIFTILRAVILAPLCEELLFRGLVFRRLKNYTNFWVGALVSAALFGLYHMNLIQGIYAFLLGILLAGVYQKYDNLWAPVLLHFGANLLSVILVYTGMEYSATWIYILDMVVMFAVSAAIWFFAIRKVPSE